METTSSKIIKGCDVKLEGRFTLDIIQPRPDLLKQPGATLVEPQVSIVESKPEFAIVEISCSCGTRMYLRCEYAGAKVPEDSQT